VVPYDVETRIGHYTEVFRHGAFADADPAELVLLATHERQALPIGRPVELRDEPTRWYGAFRVSATRAGDEVLALARDGVRLGLSVGFVPVAGGDRWSADRRRVERVKVAAHHIAVVPFPAYEGAEVLAVRTAGPPRDPHAPLLARVYAEMMRRG